MKAEASVPPPDGAPDTRPDTEHGHRSASYRRTGRRESPDHPHAGGGPTDRADSSGLIARSGRHRGGHRTDGYGGVVDLESGPAPE